MIYNNADVRRPIIEINEVTALVHMEGQKHIWCTYMV